MSKKVKTGLITGVTAFIGSLVIGVCAGWADQITRGSGSHGLAMGAVIGIAVGTGIGLLTGGIAYDATSSY